MAQQTTSLIMELTGWKLLNNNIQEEVLLPYLWTGVERWMLKSDRLVCEKNATKAQPVTNCNLGSINSVYFNYEVNLLVVRGKIFVTIDICVSLAQIHILSFWEGAGYWQLTFMLIWDRFTHFINPGRKLGSTINMKRINSQHFTVRVNCWSVWGEGLRTVQIHYIHVEHGVTTSF